MHYKTLAFPLFFMLAEGCIPMKNPDGEVCNTTCDRKGIVDGFIVEGRPDISSPPQPPQCDEFAQPVCNDGKELAFEDAKGQNLVPLKDIDRVTIKCVEGVWKLHYLNNGNPNAPRNFDITNTMCYKF